MSLNPQSCPRIQGLAEELRKANLKTKAPRGLGVLGFRDLGFTAFRVQG